MTYHKIKQITRSNEDVFTVEWETYKISDWLWNEDINEGTFTERYKIYYTNYDDDGVEFNVFVRSDGEIPHRKSRVAIELNKFLRRF